MRRPLALALLCAILPGALAMVGDGAAAAAGVAGHHHGMHVPARHRGHHRRHSRLRHPKPAPVVHAAASPQPLRFGVYPWGAPGPIGQVEPQLADNPAQALAAVKALQGSRSMTVHLYGQYTGADSGEAGALLSDAQWWSDNGVRVEMVLRYRPASPALASGFVPWVRSVATRLAAIAGVVAIQVGNEANNTGSGAGADGAYAGAVQAIADGVPAARAAVLAAGRPDIGVGFNWAAGASPCQLDPFFAQLAAAGGPAFVAAVGWVGIDVYPGTWSPPWPTVYPAANLTQWSVMSSLACLRTKQMRSAGLGSRVTITVAETGYPTDATRSEQTQASVLTEIVGAVRGVSRALGVTDLRWFDLRDANTASGQLENGYGLMHDDYSPKPAFSAYQQLIAADGL